MEIDVSYQNPWLAKKAVFIGAIMYCEFGGVLISEMSWNEGYVCSSWHHIVLLCKSDFRYEACYSKEFFLMNIKQFPTNKPSFPQYSDVCIFIVGAFLISESTGMELLYTKYLQNVKV